MTNINPLSIPHSQSFSIIAEEHGLDPEEVEALSQYFGNDFESLEHALDALEPSDQPTQPYGE